MRFRTWLTNIGTAALFPTMAAGTVATEDLPFQFHDGLIWLQVQARESAKPLNFLLDSGAGVSVINLTTAHELGLKLGRRVTVQGVHQTTTGFWPEHLSAKANSVSLPENFLAIDLNEFSRACKCAVDGLLGADFFRDRLVQIDFAARKIRLLATDSLSGMNNTVPLRVKNNALLAPIRVNGGHTQWVRLDTGCAGALHWVTSKVSAGKSGSELAVALTRISIPMAQTTVSLGKARFEAVPTGLHEDRIFDGEAGLLGTGILSRFRSVTIDARSGRLVLE